MIEQHINTVNTFLDAGEVDKAIEEFRKLGMFMQGSSQNGGLFRLSGALVTKLGKLVAKMAYIMKVNREIAFAPH